MGKKEAHPAGAGGGRRQIKSPLKARRLLSAGGGGSKLAGKKREWQPESEPEPAPQVLDEHEHEPAGAAAAAALDGGMLYADGSEEDHPHQLAQDSPQAASQEGASSDEGEEEDDADAEGEGASEEDEGSPEAAAAAAVAAAGYKSEGTRHLAGWTNFRPAEADLPDMAVPEDELRGITKRFKFTALKDAPPTTGARQRSKAEIKAAAAGAMKKAPTPLMGLTGTKPAVQAARLTTTLSQEGLVPAASRGTTANSSKQKQQQQQQTAAAATAAKAGGKRGLDGLGQLYNQKRQKAGATALAKPGAPSLAGPPAAAMAAAGPSNGRSSRKPAAMHAAAELLPAAGAVEAPTDSQPYSIHHLLQSAQRRAAAASQPTQDDSDDDDEDESGMDLATLQALMIEVVKKRKAAAQRKQAAMVAELEAEVASSLAAKEKEMAAAQQGLDVAVGHKFAALEKQLEGKMREIDGATSAFQQRLNGLWEEYRALYDQVAVAASEAEAAANKQRTAQARSLEGVREALAAKASDVARKIERGSRKASKMPELAQMLMPFLD